jgi:hypothetical protein
LGATFYDEKQADVVDDNLKEYRKFWRTNLAALQGAEVVIWGAGRTAEQLQTWFTRNRNCRAWDVDQSRFDSHQRHEMKATVIDAAEEMVGATNNSAACRPEIAVQALRDLNTERVAHFGYRGPGKRRDEAFRIRLNHAAITGANETSDSATLTEALAVVYCLAPEYRDFREMAAAFQVLCCGDDTVIAWLSAARITLEEFQRRMANLGLKAKVHDRERLELAPFCSSLAWPTVITEGGLVQQSWMLGPLPFRQLSKLGWHANPPLEFTRAELLRGKCLSLRNRCGHVPLLSTAVARGLELTKTVKDERMERYKQLHSRDQYSLQAAGPYPLTDAGIKLFLERYGMNRATYERLDHTLATWQIDEYFNGAEWSVGMHVDCDTSGVQGKFQDDDVLGRSPFYPVSDLPDPDPLPVPTPQPGGRVLGGWTQAAVLYAPRLGGPTAWDFARWYENYTGRGRVGPDAEDPLRRGRAIKILEAHDEIVAGNLTKLRTASRLTEVFVKVELLCKTEEGIEEHFAPRAIECVKEPVIAATGPFVKTFHDACLEAFPVPGAHAEVYDLPPPARVVPPRRLTCRPRAAHCLLFVIGVGVLAAALAAHGARADEVPYQGHVGTWHPQTVVGITETTDPIFLDFTGMGKAEAKRKKGKKMVMVKAGAIKKLGHKLAPKPRGRRGGGATAAATGAPTVGGVLTAGPAAAYAAIGQMTEQVTKQAVVAYLDAATLVESRAISANLPPAPVGDNQASYRWSTATYFDIPGVTDSVTSAVYSGCYADPVGNAQVKYYTGFASGVPTTTTSVNVEGYSLWAAAFYRVRLVGMSLRIISSGAELYVGGLSTVSCVDSGTPGMSRAALEGEHVSTTYANSPGQIMTYPWLGREPTVDYQWVATNATATTGGTSILWHCAPAAAGSGNFHGVVYAIWEGIPLIDTDTVYNAVLNPVDRPMFNRLLMAELAVRPVDERRILSFGAGAQRDGVRTTGELNRMGAAFRAIGRGVGKAYRAVRGSQGNTLMQRLGSLAFNLVGAWISESEWEARVVSMLRPNEFEHLRGFIAANPTLSQDEIEKALYADKESPKRPSQAALTQRAFEHVLQLARKHGAFPPPAYDEVKEGAVEGEWDGRGPEPLWYTQQRFRGLIDRLNDPSLTEAEHGRVRRQLALYLGDGDTPQEGPYADMERLAQQALERDYQANRSAHPAYAPRPLRNLPQHAHAGAGTEVPGVGIVRVNPGPLRDDEDHVIVSPLPSRRAQSANPRT